MASTAMSSLMATTVSQATVSQATVSQATTVSQVTQVPKLLVSKRTTPIRKESKGDVITIVYCRVSTPQQRDQLPTQKSDVCTVVKRVYGVVHETLSTVGSGREFMTLTKKLVGVTQHRRINKNTKVILAVKDVSRLTRCNRNQINDLQRLLIKHKITHVFLANLGCEIDVRKLDQSGEFMDGMDAAHIEGLAIRDRIRDAELLKPLCFERRINDVDVCIVQMRDLAHAIAVTLEENPESDPDYTVSDLIEMFRRIGVDLDLDLESGLLSKVYGVDVDIQMSEMAEILNRYCFYVGDVPVVKKWTSAVLKKWARHYNRYVEKTNYVPAPLYDADQMVDAFTNLAVQPVIQPAVHSAPVGADTQWITFYYDGSPDSIPPTWTGPTPPKAGFYTVRK